jgi:hypothetical protein
MIYFFYNTLLTILLILFIPTFCQRCSKRGFPTVSLNGWGLRKLSEESDGPRGLRGRGFLLVSS